MHRTKRSFPSGTISLELSATEKIESCNQTITLSESTAEETNSETPKEKKNPFLGIFYIFLSTIMFGLSSVIVKKLAYISPGQLTFLRNAGVFAGSLPIAIACEKNIFGKKKDWILLIARSFLGTTALYLNVLAYALLPLADAAIILSVMPAMTILFARIYLRESCSWTQSVVLMITLCGIFLSARLPELLKKRSDYQFDHNYISGLAAAVGSVITLSFTYVTLRKMKDIHFSITMLYFGVLGMIENAVINGVMASYAPANFGWDQFLYVSIGILAFAANATLTLAFQAETAGVISVVRASIEIVVAMVYQIIFFKNYPDLYNVAGGLLVISSLGILGIRNWLLSLPENSESRKKFKYLLM